MDDPRGHHRTRRIVLALLAVFLPLALAACTAPASLLRPKFTATLDAADLITKAHFDQYEYDGGLCFHRLVIAYGAEPGTVLVGADNYFAGGSGPFPCIEKVDWAYRGGVRFNLSEFRSFTGIVIEKATLSWKIDSAIVRDGNGDPSGVPNGADVTNCVGALMEGKQSPFTQGAFLPAIPYLKGKGDVTAIVQSWVMNGDPNWGFVLVGFDESYSRNNAACLNTLSHFTLTLIYTRA